MIRKSDLADAPLLEELVQGFNASSAATQLLLLGAGEDALVVIVVDSVDNADGLADDADAAKDRAGGRSLEGEDWKGIFVRFYQGRTGVKRANSLSASLKVARRGVMSLARAVLSVSASAKGAASAGVAARRARTGTMVNCILMMVFEFGTREWF